MPKTRRSNEPYKRHHWHSARTARRNRFASALKSWKRIRSMDPELYLETRDQDMQLRRGSNVSRGHGRGGVSFEGERRPHVDWITADKSRLRHQLERGQISLGRAAELERRLNF
jgi:hypothetical protein